MTETKKIKCPCCGKTLVEEYDICDVCNWENDPQQLNSPDSSGGANQMSLNQAIKVFKSGKPVN